MPTRRKPTPPKPTAPKPKGRLADALVSMGSAKPAPMEGASITVLPALDEVGTGMGIEPVYGIGFRVADFAGALAYKVLAEILTQPGPDQCGCWVCSGTAWMAAVRRTGATLQDLWRGTEISADQGRTLVRTRWVHTDTTGVGFYMEVRSETGWGYPFDAKAKTFSTAPTGAKQVVHLLIRERVAEKDLGLLVNDLEFWGMVSAPFEGLIPHVLWPSQAHARTFSMTTASSLRSPKKLIKEMGFRDPNGGSRFWVPEVPALLTATPLDTAKLEGLLAGRGRLMSVDRSVFGEVLKAFKADEGAGACLVTLGGTFHLKSSAVRQRDTAGLALSVVHQGGTADLPAAQEVFRHAMDLLDPEALRQWMASRAADVLQEDEAHEDTLLWLSGLGPEPNDQPQPPIGRACSSVEAPPLVPSVRKGKPAAAPLAAPAPPPDGTAGTPKAQPLPAAAPGFQLVPPTAREALTPPKPTKPRPLAAKASGTSAPAPAAPEPPPPVGGLTEAAVGALKALSTERVQMLDGLRAQAEILARSLQHEDALISHLAELDQGRVKAEAEAAALRDELKKAKAASEACETSAGAAREALEAKVRDLTSKAAALEADLEIARAIRQVEPVPLPEPAAAPAPTPPPPSPVLQDPVPGTPAELLDDEAAGTDPQYFARFTVPIPIEEVAEQYAAWILGLGPGAGKSTRRNRLNQGALPEWTLDTLRDHKIDLEGDGGFRVSVRTGPAEVLMRMAHPDTGWAKVTWSNLARLRAVAGGTEVEHALLRTVDGRAPQAARIGIPAIVRELLVQAPVKAPWEDFRGDARRYHAGTVKDLVAILTNPARDLPVVVVSRSQTSGVPLLDADAMAADLHGLAVVYTPADNSDVFGFTDALVAAGLDRRFSVFDGWARIYMPGLEPGTDPNRHPVWNAPRIQKWGPARTQRFIVRDVVGRAVPLRAKPGFLRAIEAFDLEAAKTHLEELRASGTEEAQLEAAQAQIQALEEALAAAQQELEGTIPRLQNEKATLAEENKVLEDLVGEVERKAAQVARDLEEKKGEAFRLSQKLEAAEPQAVVAPVADNDLLDGLLHDSYSEVEQILRLIAARYADRIVVLPSALASARDSKYEYLNPLRDLLLTFATDYWEALAAYGDATASGILGADSYASHESKSLSQEGKRLRTFEYKGESVLMERHLKRTHGHERNTSNRVIRVHFHWDSDDEKLVIGWCGKHLKL